MDWLFGSTASPAAAPLAPSAFPAPAPEEVSAPWNCIACTYLHQGDEAKFLSCAVCGTEAPSVPSTTSNGRSAPVSDDAGLIHVATILNASRTIDSALASRADREPIISSLLQLPETSMASRIAQARQARQAIRAAASAKAKGETGSPTAMPIASAAGICLKCGLPVESLERAVNVRRYLLHTQCQTCTSCGRTLGDDLELAMNASGVPTVYCREHAEAARTADRRNQTLAAPRRLEATTSSAAGAQRPSSPAALPSGPAPAAAA